MSSSFITWYPSCRRSDALAESLGGTSHLIHYLEFKQPLYAPLKYALQAVATLRQLVRDKPELILVASPPVFAVLVVWLYSKVFRVPYVVDAHTGVFDDPRWTWLLSLTKYLSRHAVATIVTSEFLKEEVESWGAKALVIGDVPVNFPSQVPAELGPGFHVIVINTFSQDEPLDAVLEAASNLQEVQFHITGNTRHSRKNLTQAVPANARFTGWLSDEDYSGLLRAADVVVCLTTNDHTMQRGGYEAMALERPLITSDWEILRGTFSRGTIHVENTVRSIQEAICQARANQAELVEGMRQLRQERFSCFKVKLGALQEALAHGREP